MTVFMDENEYANDKTYYNLLKNKGLKVELMKIGFCDYIVKAGDYAVGIERKSPSDFVASIKDGRVFNQAYMMSVVFPTSYIIIVGYLAEALLYSRMRKEALVGALVSLSLKTAPNGQKGRVNIIFVEFPEDFANFIYYLHRKLEKGDLAQLPRLRVRGKTSMTRKEITMMLLQAIPGIGTEKAKKIAERFETIKDIIDAPISELTKIEGIGYDTARKIKYYLGAVK